MTFLILHAMGNTNAFPLSHCMQDILPSYMQKTSSILLFWLCRAAAEHDKTHVFRIKLMSESVSWCAHHLQNGDGRVQMGSGLLKLVGSSAQVGGQVLKWKGQPCSLGMAFTIWQKHSSKIVSMPFLSQS